MGCNQNLWIAEIKLLVFLIVCLLLLISHFYNFLTISTFSLCIFGDFFGGVFLCLFVLDLKTSLMSGLRTKHLWCSCLVFSYLPKETGASILLRDVPLHGSSKCVEQLCCNALSPLLALVWKHPKLWHCSLLTQGESRDIILLQMKMDWYIRVNSKTLSAYPSSKLLKNIDRLSELLLPSALRTDMAGLGWDTAAFQSGSTSITLLWSHRRRPGLYIKLQQKQQLSKPSDYLLVIHHFLFKVENPSKSRQREPEVAA